MTKTEERAFLANMAYQEAFGDGSIPSVDMMPREYLDLDTMSELMEKCVAEGKPIETFVTVREYEPGMVY